jgi:hypothetical protein
MTLIIFGALGPSTGFQRLSGKGVSEKCEAPGYGGLVVFISFEFK